MLKEKVEELVKRLGGDTQAKEKVDALLQAADATDKAAQKAGLTAKEEKPKEEPKPETAQPDAKPEEAKGGDPESPTTEYVVDLKLKEFRQEQAALLAETLAPMLAEIKQMSEAQSATAKEAGANLAKQFEAITTKQSELDKRLAGLEGLTPRAYRATQDPKTEVSKETAKEKAPHGDEQADKGLANWLASWQ